MAFDLRHYTKDPLGALRSKNPALPHTERALGKPCGLWLSVYGEDDWPSWCKGESFGLDRLALEYRIVLKDAAKLLVLDSALAIDDATHRYGLRYEDMFPNWPKHLHGGNFKDLDWARIGADYQGIVIAPYQWSRRLDGIAGWYYGWDCASGCIWDIDAISETALMELVDA